MNTKLIVGTLLVLVLSSSSAVAYLGTREATLPGGADTAGGGAGLAFCERVSDAASPTALYCEEGGFAAIFADVGCDSDFLPTAPLFFGDGVGDNDQTAGNGDTTTSTASSTPCLDDAEAWAGGDVTIKFAGGVGGEVAAMVGNDRDDDGSIETSDEDGSSDTTDENDVPVSTCNTDALPQYDDPARSGCYDDEFSDTVVGFVDADNDLPQIDFCFTHDRDHADDGTTINPAWDDIVVFLSSNLPGTDTPYVGSASVILDVESNSDHDTACGDNTPRSGHSDETASFGGTPFAADVIPTVPNLPGGVIVIVSIGGVVSVQVDVTDLDCGIDTDVTTSTSGEIPLIAIGGVLPTEPYSTEVECAPPADSSASDAPDAARYCTNVFVAGVMVANPASVPLPQITAKSECVGPAALSTSIVLGPALADADTNAASIPDALEPWKCSAKIDQGIVAAFVVVCGVTFPPIQ